MVDTPTVELLNGQVVGPSGSFTVKTLSTVVDAIEGTVGHGDDAEGNPSLIGYNVKAGLSGVTPLAADKRTDGHGSTDGAIYVRAIPNEDLVHGSQTITNGDSTSVISSAGAGTKNYITDITIGNSSDTDCTVLIRDGIAGATLWPCFVPAGCAYNKTLRSALGGTAATAVYADPDAALSSIIVGLSGYKSKV